MPNPRIAPVNPSKEIDKRRRGGDRHIAVWGGVGLWRSLMRLDLIDEFRLDLHPYAAGAGTCVPSFAARFQLSVSSFSNAGSSG